LGFVRWLVHPTHQPAAAASAAAADVDDASRG